jgi:hypothetical protein
MVNMSHLRCWQPLWLLSRHEGWEFSYPIGEGVGVEFTRGRSRRGCELSPSKREKKGDLDMRGIVKL